MTFLSPCLSDQRTEDGHFASVRVSIWNRNSGLADALAAPPRPGVICVNACAQSLNVCARARYVL
jgi:hypothetical protein